MHFVPGAGAHELVPQTMHFVLGAQCIDDPLMVQLNTNVKNCLCILLNKSMSRPLHNSCETVRRREDNTDHNSRTIDERTGPSKVMEDAAKYINDAVSCISTKSESANTVACFSW